VPLKWDNTSLTICEGPAPWRVGLLNCVAHLDDLDAAPLADSGASVTPSDMSRLPAALVVAGVVLASFGPAGAQGAARNVHR